MTKTWLADTALRGEIASILERHESPGAIEAHLTWWTLRPAAFHVARNEQGIAGFYVSMEASQLCAELASADPIIQAL